MQFYFKRLPDGVASEVIFLKEQRLCDLNKGHSQKLRQSLSQIEYEYLVNWIAFGGAVQKHIL